MSVQLAIDPGQRVYGATREYHYSAHPGLKENINRLITEQAAQQADQILPKSLHAAARAALIAILEIEARRATTVTVPWNPPIFAQLGIEVVDWDGRTTPVPNLGKTDPQVSAHRGIAIGTELEVVLNLPDRVSIRTVYVAGDEQH